MSVREDAGSSDQTKLRTHARAKPRVKTTIAIPLRKLLILSDWFLRWVAAMCSRVLRAESMQTMSFVYMMTILSNCNPHVNAHEGFIKGVGRCVESSAPYYNVASISFVAASDADCCVLGYASDRKGTGEHFLVANRGNKTAISVEVVRESGAPLSLDGEWRVRNFVEQDKRPIDDTHDSRFLGMVRSAAIYNFAVPVFLDWERLGVSRSVLDDALKGKAIEGENDCGVFKFECDGGLKRIEQKKFADKSFGATGEKVGEMRFPNLKSKVVSILAEYQFDSPRKSYSNEAFACKGTILYELANGEKLKALLEMQATECESSSVARKFIDEFFSKLPDDKPIVSRKELTTVLQNGKQKVAVDLDVTRSEKAVFSNSASFAYYAIASALLLLCGGWAYHRWKS